MTAYPQRLTDGWRFRRPAIDENWEPVYLPHSPFVSDLDGRDHWHGLCEYQRCLKVEAPQADFQYALRFGAAMHSATIRVDGEEAGRHRGGYLPFEVDVSRWVKDGNEHELHVLLDNGDNPDIPPGKPFQELDFCYYGGLYRHVELRAYPSLHVTDPVAAGEVASGGVFVRVESASPEKAQLAASAHVRNAGQGPREFSIGYRIRDDGGAVVAQGQSEPLFMEGGEALTHRFAIVLEKPLLWSVEAPFLHTIEVALLQSDGSIADRVEERIGVRTLSFSRTGGLTLNGKRIRPRGANRHQDYPRVGYALSDAAQYRDAKRIKESGFDYVRLSHYPQSPAFLDACDELGILVMNCIPGWQFMGGGAFREACYQSARELVRRDRNHPCVVLWELSLNETEMDDAFMDTMMRIGHEEYPGDQMFVCGWLDRFDVFTHSRQHGLIHSWENGDKALVVAEYGDWEFYAANEGFDQKTGAGLLEESLNSRAFRSAGEGRLRRQARNHIVALNDTLSSPAVCDGLWSMYDYPRGYHPTRAACGVMDIHRLPKYSYFFFRSQRAPSENGPGWIGGPMVYVASRWMPDSRLDVLVFSNCEQVELRLNGVSVGPARSPRDGAYPHLPFPPFVFEIEQFNPGRLEATSFLGGAAVASHWVATPGEPASLLLSIDDDGRAESLEALDVLLAHARILDGEGVLCKQSTLEVAFSAEGEVDLVGPRQVAAESGIASVVVRRLPGCRGFLLRASSQDLEGDERVYRVGPLAHPAVETRP